MTLHHHDSLPMLLQRMSDETRQVLYFARQAVSDHGSATVEPEHVLLGILHHGQGPAVTLLRDTCHLEMAALIDRVASRIERKPTFSTTIEVPFGPTTKEVIAAAVEEADRLRQRAIRPEHLLLGILRIATTIPAAILSTHGVTLDFARVRLRN
jgi:ATP-dependent Clp protease ATP-binding subunit ClpC